MLFLGREYARRGWVQQYHIGALRNNSGRSFKELGPDAGFDAMNDLPFAEKLAALLDALDRENSLPKTVLYCLNPKDNETLAALINCFQRGAGQNAVRFGLVVQRSKRRHRAADGNAFPNGARFPLYRHAYRFAQFSLLYAA